MNFLLLFLAINNLVNIYYNFSYVKTDFVTLERVGMEGPLTMTMPIDFQLSQFCLKPWWLISMHDSQSKKVSS